ncbi:YktB family protein [Thalassobacillus hwangdonensis]|uniref:UPF0637 protein ACFQ2J_02325 n=1 Tax=Thalassobacillus hwangdonensis TaxID=546108 RepID=A0ABW3L0C3_9BACI
MNEFQGFKQKDFDIFSIPGLEERMEALRANLSPKLEDIATELAPDLTAMTGDEMFVHVAKHARRSKNPPNDTWAALANNKRGYKKLPHFQVGLWETHVFIWFAVIYESPIKQDYAEVLSKHQSNITTNIPGNFVWSMDHTKPDAKPHGDMTEEDFTHMIDRLKNVKKSEFLCGIQIDRNDDVLRDRDAFLDRCRQTFETLKPLYELTREIS